MLGKQGTMRHADAVIVTAINLEYKAVLEVSDGAVAGTKWDEVQQPSGLPLAFRSFTGRGGIPLTVAITQAPNMGATAAANALLPLLPLLMPRCIAMCGVCAGPRGKVQLGDVVAADRLLYHDTGKQKKGEVQQDLTTYNLRPDWKIALERMKPAAHFRDASWLQQRPASTEHRELRALVALRDEEHEPWRKVDGELKQGEWSKLVRSLRKQKLLSASGKALTTKGKKAVEDWLFDHQGTLPDLSPQGDVAPFSLHVAPIASGAKVIEDEDIWGFVSRSMRKTLGLEMEAAVLGEVAHYQQHHKLDAVVMKGVMDFADHGRDDHFKQFAARASAECLLWFLRENVEASARPVTGGPPAPVAPARAVEIRPDLASSPDEISLDPQKGLRARFFAGTLQSAVEELPFETALLVLSTDDDADLTGSIARSVLEFFNLPPARLRVPRQRIDPRTCLFLTELTYRSKRLRLVASTVFNDQREPRAEDQWRAAAAVLDAGQAHGCDLVLVPPMGTGEGRWPPSAAMRSWLFGAMRWASSLAREGALLTPVMCQPSTAMQRHFGEYLEGLKARDLSDMQRGYVRFSVQHGDTRRPSGEVRFDTYLGSVVGACFPELVDRDRSLRAVARPGGQLDDLVYPLNTPLGKTVFADGDTIELIDEHADSRRR